MQVHFDVATGGDLWLPGNVSTNVKMLCMSYYPNTAKYTSAIQHVWVYKNTKPNSQTGKVKDGQKSQTDIVREIYSFSILHGNSYPLIII